MPAELFSLLYCLLIGYIVVIVMASVEAFVDANRQLKKTIGIYRPGKAP